MKEFNTTAVCIPSKHYMVDLSERVAQIRDLVDAGKYLTINRARQYGKTTTLNALDRSLSSDYYVVSMDFQDYGADTFRDEDSFCRDFSINFCLLLGKRTSQCHVQMKEAIDNLKKMAGDMGAQMRMFTMFMLIQEIIDHV